MTASILSPWELRGFLAHPNHFGKPKPGSNEEMSWSRGWAKADYQSRLANQSALALELENDENFGRDTYASNYVSDRDQINLEF